MIMVCILCKKPVGFFQPLNKQDRVGCLCVYCFARVVNDHNAQEILSLVTDPVKGGGKDKQ